MSSSPKIIAVIGATGTQGGSVASYLLKDKEFSVRAVTRNAGSDASKALKEAGAEIAVADLDDVKALEKAFQGVYGVFGVTDFWTIFPKHNYAQKETQLHEEQHGRNLIDAAVAAGVKHFVWSTLEGSPAGCYHWESKATIDKYLKTTQLPHTSLYTSLYFENLTKFGMLKKAEGSDGFELNIGLPNDVKIQGFSADETGGWALAAFKNPNEWIGKDIPALGETLTPPEWAEVLRKVSGKPVKLPEISRELFESEAFGEQLGNEMWLNHKVFVGGYCKRDASLSKKAYPEASSFEQWARKDAALQALFGSK